LIAFVTLFRNRGSMIKKVVVPAPSITVVLGSCSNPGELPWVHPRSWIPTWVLVLWHARVLVLWHARVLVLWHARVLVLWHARVLELLILVAISVRLINAFI
jgi:hypothetical protein